MQTYPTPQAAPPIVIPSIGGLEPTELLWLAVIGGVAIAASILFLVWVLKNFRYIAAPNQALIFSGKTYTNEEGQKLGFRIVTSGKSAIRIPVLERVDSIDMTLIPIDVVVQNAYSKGNIPLQIHAIANVKVHSDPRYIGNAIERFLGRSRNEIQVVAQQNLEGAVREVIAGLTPEEVNEDRLKFAERMILAAVPDLDKLGLALDTLKIQHVADDTEYLNSLGRPRIAGALRDAENAENQAMQETSQAQSISDQRAEVAKATAETMVIQRQNELRRRLAELDGHARAIEVEAEVAAKTARAEAERALQGVRAELEKKRLQAEVVIPAEIHREAQATIAKGDAAPTLENGAAAVEVLRAMNEAWMSMGSEAREIYVIQHLEEIVGTIVDRVKPITPDEVHLIDSGDGASLSAYASAYPQMVAQVMRTLAETTGVDVPAILASPEKPRFQGGAQ